MSWQVQETGDVSLLGVSAPDERTFVVSLQGSHAHFLAEVCAGAWTMPVRDDLLGAWGDSADATVTNGAYTAVHLSRNLVTLERSETYYDSSPEGPDEIRFVTREGSQADYDKLLTGDLGDQAPGGAEGEVPQPLHHCLGINGQTEGGADVVVVKGGALGVQKYAVGGGHRLRHPQAAVRQGLEGLLGQAGDQVQIPGQQLVVVRLGPLPGDEAESGGPGGGFPPPGAAERRLRL